MLFISLVVKSVRQKLMKILKGIWKKLWFNTIIQTILICFLPQVVNVSVALLNSYLLGKTAEDNIASYAQLGVFAIIPLLWTGWIAKNRFHLTDNKVTQERFGELFQGIKTPNMEYNRNCVFMAPIFLMRRLVFCFIPYLLFAHESL